MQKIINRYRYSYILLRQLVITDFKVRYQGSALGYLWTLLRPLALFAVLYFVFGVAFNLGATIPFFPVYLLLGIIVWNYFTEVTVGSVSTIVGRGDMIRKINFPKYVIILAGSFSALINLSINFVILGIVMYFNGVDISSKVFLMPLLIFQLFVISLSLAFLLSALFVKFRDINYIWEVIVQVMFYATPILYPISFVIDRASLGLGQLMMLNPLAQIIQDMRYVLVTDKTQTISEIFANSYARVIPIAICLVLTIFAVMYFRARSKYFAEEV